MTTGEKLAMLRHQAGKTGEQLVELLNKKYKPVKPITPEMYRKWETDVNEFTWEHAMAMAHYFEVTLDELINPKLKVQRLIEKKPPKGMVYNAKKGKLVGI
jgi:transcriptional regulator with XRE-family HTH domain